MTTRKILCLADLVRVTESIWYRTPFSGLHGPYLERFNFRGYLATGLKLIFRGGDQRLGSVGRYTAMLTKVTVN